MTPNTIDIPTLEWVIKEIQEDKQRYIQGRMRTEAFLAAMDEMINTFECVVSRVKRGEGLHPTSSLM